VTCLVNHTHDPRTIHCSRTDAPHPLPLPDQPKKPIKRPIKQRQSLAEKQPGTTLFPISRVKRIIKADKDLDMMTGEACFMISVATVSRHALSGGTNVCGMDGWNPGAGWGLVLSHCISGCRSEEGIHALSSPSTGTRQAGHTASKVFEVTARTSHRTLRWHLNDPRTRADHPPSRLVSCVGRTSFPGRQLIAAAHRNTSSSTSWRKATPRLDSISVVSSTTEIWVSCALRVSYSTLRPSSLHASIPPRLTWNRSHTPSLRRRLNPYPPIGSPTVATWTDGVM
jgi:hypothetical protein